MGHIKIINTQQTKAKYSEKNKKENNLKTNAAI
jgi:hypothetical protein